MHIVIQTLLCLNKVRRKPFLEKFIYYFFIQIILMTIIDPKISVIIPAKNSQRTIGKCLMHILNQNYKPYEIIVVDGGSNDRTQEIATKYGAKVIIEPTHEGNYPGIGRNYGAKNAQGEILAFIDSDCYAEENWLMKVKDFLRYEEIGIYGIIVKDGTGSLISRAYHYLINEISYDFSPSRCMAIRKEIFDKIKGFDETLTAGEDNEISYRVISLGYKIVIDKETKVYHEDDHLKSLRGIWNQQKWYYESEKMLRQRYPYKFRRFRTTTPIREHLTSLIKALRIGGIKFTLTCLVIKFLSMKRHL